MGHEGKPVGTIGLNGVGSDSGRQPCTRGNSNRSVVPEGMHPGAAALIVCRQQVSAAAVGGQKAWGIGRRDAASTRQPSRARSYAMTGYLRDLAVPHVEALPVGTYRQQGRSA